MDFSILIIIGLAVAGLLSFLILRNRQDEKAFKNQLNNDYRKPKEDESDVEADEITK
jgi:uncharacterized membrane protein YgaE (UPF0421/DUF939 family)